MYARFGVIHAVFTNLLVWSNGVMTEAEHALNDHKRRLSAVGYFNFTVWGKGNARLGYYIIPGLFYNCGFISCPWHLSSVASLNHYCPVYHYTAARKPSKSI